MNASDILIPGVHNIENYMAAIALVEGLASDDAIRQVARTFGGVEHRIELVRELHGVKYYNDSIASSPSRTIAGLHSFKQKVILIAGGYDKHIPFDVLGPEICAHVKTLVRDAGYAWFDWNTMTGDAQYTFSSDREMLDYTLKQTEDKDVIILLMHEGKARTRRILPELVAHFREAGYEFRALSTSEEEREILSRCGAHMMLPDAAQE